MYQRAFPNVWRTNKEHAYTISFRYQKKKHNRSAFRDAKKSYQLFCEIQDTIERFETHNPIHTDRLLDRTVEILSEPKIGILKARRTGRLDTLVAEYRELMEARECNQDYIQHFCTRIGLINAGCEFSAPSNIEAGQVEKFLKALRDGDKKLSRKTSNEYLSAYRTWCDWLVHEGYILANPVAAVLALNVEPDIRRRRRAMGDDHFAKLLEATAKRRSRRSLSCELRVWVYRLARETGFRAAELASLTPTHFDLTAPVAVIVLEAGDSKHEKQDRQVLPASLVPELAAWIEGKPRDQRLFSGRWYRRAAEMLRDDLKAAKIEATNERGETYDFHSLRHSFITGLARAGVHPKKAQKLARHANISLTMQTYTHVEEDGELAAAVGLASPSSPPSSPRACSEGHSGARGGREDVEAGEAL
jgi:integrase